MKKFLCISLITMAAASLQAVTINKIVNNSSQDALLIVFSKPIIQDAVNLNTTFIGFEDSLSPVESSVYLITRASITKKAPVSGPTYLEDGKRIILSTSQGQTDIGPCDLDEILIDENGKVKITYIGWAF